jgi:integrase
MTRLTPLAVKNAKPGRHGDGKGLYLLVKPSGAKSWVLRVVARGRRQDIGLGSTDWVSLAEARERASALRKHAKEGRSPIGERDREKVVIPTFKEALEMAHAEFAKGWSDKTAEQFKASLDAHAVPVIGRRRADDIELAHIIAVLAPIWTEKPQMARKVRHRLMKTLAFAKSRGWRSVPPPETREISDGLARQPKSKGFRAVPFAEVPAVVAGELTKAETPARLALLFTILTAARSGEVRKARWEQIDREAKVWRRPAEIMKAGEPHVITLSAAALVILDRASKLSGDRGLIFPTRSETPLSDAALGKMLREAGRTETVHGFRSSFRDWAAEKMPTVPAMVAEMALAHSVGTKTEQAYLRSDLRDMRRALTDAWGRFVAPSLSGEGDNVVSLDTAKTSTG